MAEAVGRESIGPRLEQPVIRSTAPKAPWWRNLLMALGITVAGGIGINETFNQPTQEQKRAEITLNDPKIPKRTLRVIDDSEVVEAGGLAVRSKPGADTPGDPPASKRLPPNYIIKDAVSWVPLTPELPSNKGGWVAFKNEDGKVMFASSKFLAE